MWWLGLTTDSAVLKTPSSAVKGGAVAGTREDATLLVELAKWGAMIDFGEATRKLWAEEFDPDTAEATDPEVQTALYFFETIGTLVKNGLLDRDLVYDWLWVAGVWERVAPAATRARERSTSQMYENFEALAGGQRERSATPA